MRTLSLLASARQLMGAMLVLGAGSAALAVETRVIRDDSFSQFLQGESTGTQLLSDGFLKIAPEADRLDKTDEAVGWRVAVDRVDGQIFFSTGHDGKVFRHVPGQKPELWAKLPEGQAISLTLDPTGALVVGASPGGKIYRVVQKEKPQLLFDTKEQYIWDLIFDRDGVLYAATGPNGKIFRIRGANNGEVYYDSEGTNVMALDFDAQGRLLAATQGRGMVIRISGPGEAYVMYTSTDDEVRGLASDLATGELYAAVNGVKASSPLLESDASKAKSGSSSESASSSSSRSASSSSYLVQIHPSGFVSKFWPSPEGPIHSVMMDPTTSGSILVAAGKSGRVYRVAPNADHSVLADVVEPMVLSIAAAPDGTTYFTTANKASLYKLRRPNERGIFASRALNAGSTVQWGNIALDVQLTSGAKVLIETRTGNTPDPTDKTWSSFTTATLAGDRFAKIESPVAQYLQYRLTLQGIPGTGEEADLVLDAVQVFYVQRNAPPLLQEINISKEGDGDASMSSLLAMLSSSRRPTASSSSRPSSSGSDDDDAGSAARSASSSSRPTVSSSSGSSAGRGSADGDGRPTGPGGKASQNSKRFRISWDVSDPNGDRMLSTVSLKADDEQLWRVVEEDLTSNQHALPTDSLADGRYRVQVAVTDAPENPAQSATSATLVSQLFIVDNTAPVIKRLEARPTGTPGEWEVTAEAEDATSILSGAEYALSEIDRFSTVVPEDGVFDFPRETFRFTVRPTDPKPEHVLTLRINDREGNLQVGKVILK